VASATIRPAAERLDMQVLTFDRALLAAFPAHTRDARS